MPIFNILKGILSEPIALLSKNFDIADATSKELVGIRKMCVFFLKEMCNLCVKNCAGYISLWIITIFGL